MGMSAIRPVPQGPGFLLCSWLEAAIAPSLDAEIARLVR